MGSHRRNPAKEGVVYAQCKCGEQFNAMEYEEHRAMCAMHVADEDDEQGLIVDDGIDFWMTAGGDEWGVR